MPIACSLFENNITSDPDDYAAMVQISGSADGDAEGRTQPRRERERGGSPKVQDIVDQGSTVNKPDILAVTATLKLALLDGTFPGAPTKDCEPLSLAVPCHSV
ncbi:MAG: hypothetical protein KAY37_15795 [Phycisphaerae bacterium]|nr:hypothetical protein [Phycisphaerae bacterium]